MQQQEPVKVSGLNSSQLESILESMGVAYIKGNASFNLAIA